MPGPSSDCRPLHKDVSVQSHLRTCRVFPQATRARRRCISLAAAPKQYKVLPITSAARQKSSDQQVNKRDSGVGKPHLYPRPSIAKLRQFEKLWMEHREDLQLSKQTTSAIMDEVRKGRLPCNAQLLRSRVRELVLLDPLEPRLRLRQLLAAAPRAVLLHEPSLLLSRAAKFAALLPSYDTTHVLMIILPYLDREPHVTAMNFLELDDVFGRAFGGARVPPSVFAYLLRPSGASVLPPAARVEAQAATPSPIYPVLKVEQRPAEPQQQTQQQAQQHSMDAGIAGGAEQGGTATGTEGAAARPSGGQQQVGRVPSPWGAHTHKQPHHQQQGRWLKAETPQRRYIDPYRLLRRLQALVALFGRETAYVAVQRHPPLLDREPDDLASRLAQLLAAVDPRVSAGELETDTALVQTTARVLEDAPEVLYLEMGEVRQRLGELSAALEWNPEQVAHLAAHDPRVLASDPSRCRENLIRLRLYALRRPATWGAELCTCLGLTSATATAAAAPANLATPAAAQGRSANAAGGKLGGSGNGSFPSPVVDMTQVKSQTVPTRGTRTAGAPGAPSRSDGSLVGAQNTATPDTATAPATESVGASSVTRGSDPDPNQLSILARILTADEEVIGRLEYLISSGERQGTTLRELMFESRVRFLRQCPSYSRWWAEGAARERGEGDSALVLAVESAEAETETEAAIRADAGGGWEGLEEGVKEGILRFDEWEAGSGGDEGEGWDEEEDLLGGLDLGL